MSFAFYAFCLSLFLNLCILFLAKRFHLFIDLDTSNKPQRFHSLPTPRAGGIGIFAPFFLSLGFLSFYHANPLLQGILWGGSIVFLSGIIEDFNASLSPKIRLILQCLGGGIFIYLSKVYLTDLGFGITLPIYLGIPFSIFAIVGIINAINIIDGFNGLASGLVMCALACISFLLPSSPLSFVIFILLGGIFGFFVLNFPWGKIFLGDGGAYFLGFILSVLLIIITQNNGGGGEKEISPWFGIALLIYPFWEVIFSIYRRRGKASAFLPDNYHLHQILYRFIKIKTKSKWENPLTSFLILCFILPLMIAPLLFCNNQNILLTFCLLFILLYLFLYKKLKNLLSPHGLE